MVNNCYFYFFIFFNGQSSPDPSVCEHKRFSRHYSNLAPSILLSPPHYCPKTQLMNPRPAGTENQLMLLAAAGAASHAKSGSEQDPAHREILRVNTAVLWWEGHHCQLYYGSGGTMSPSAGCYINKTRVDPWIHKWYQGQNAQIAYWRESQTNQRTNNAQIYSSLKKKKKISSVGIWKCYLVNKNKKKVKYTSANILRRHPHYLAPFLCSRPYLHGMTWRYGPCIIHTMLPQIAFAFFSLFSAPFPPQSYIPDLFILHTWLLALPDNAGILLPLLY